MQPFDVQVADDTLLSRRVWKPRSLQRRCRVCAIAFLCLLVGKLIYLRNINASPESNSCIALTNHESHYKIEIGLGLPSQQFSVVVDTGSNDVMIPSCSCVALGMCVAERCYSENRSDLYSQFTVSGRQLAFRITYGSGTVLATVITDVVSIQDRHVYMPGGILLMQDTRELNMNQSFEGILGLGLPADVWLVEVGQVWSPPALLDQWGVKCFSICFRQNGPGVLRFGSPVSGKSLTIVGDSNWKLAFGGASVGDATAAPHFCAAGTESCEAIIDTGATFLYGPLVHVTELFINLCKRWRRCVERAIVSEDTAMSDVFTLLLEDCESWLRTSAAQFREVPSLFLHFPDETDQDSVSLELSPIAFIYQTEADGRSVCLPAIGSNDDESDTVWSLGLPLFFEYTISFDSSAEPPAVAFSKIPCADCEGDDADASAAPLPMRRKGIVHDVRKPWQILGSVRPPSRAR